MGIELDDNQLVLLLCLGGAEMLVGNLHRPPFVARPEVGQMQSASLTGFQLGKQTVEKELAKRIDTFVLSLVGAVNMHGTDDWGL